MFPFTCSVNLVANFCTFIDNESDNNEAMSIFN